MNGDHVGTVRVCEKFGTIAVYVKVDENTWRTIYIDPRRNQYLIPTGAVSDGVATLHPPCFLPKPVE